MQSNYAEENEVVYGQMTLRIRFENDIFAHQKKKLLKKASRFTSYVISKKLKLYGLSSHSNILSQSIFHDVAS